ncbi:uncharacterized protein LOC144821874 isoform X2 [Lissotriton helveticus]
MRSCSLLLLSAAAWSLILLAIRPHHVVIVSSTSEALTLGYAAHTTCVMDIRGAKVAAPGQHMLRQLEGESQRWQEQLVMHQLETSESNKVPDVLASMPPLI